MSKLKGYTSFNIGGKRRPFKWGTNSSIMYCEKRGETLADFQAFFDVDKMKRLQMTGSEFRDILWAGLYAGAKTDGLEIEFDDWNVGDWIDKLSQEALGEIYTKAMALILGTDLSEKSKKKSTKEPKK